MCRHASIFLMVGAPALSIGLASRLVPGLAYRMRVEERLLTEQLGDAYIHNKNQSKQLIPWIW